MATKPNSHPYKITQLPEGFSCLAIAAWKTLDDRELFEIDGTLVFTDSIESYLEGTSLDHLCADEFSSFAAFEKWLLAAAADWLRDEHCAPMVEAFSSFLALR